MLKSLLGLLHRYLVWERSTTQIVTKGLGLVKNQASFFHIKLPPLRQVFGLSCELEIVYVDGEDEL